MSPDPILEMRLAKRQDVSDREWAVWERKTFSMHRVVLVWMPAQPQLRYAAVSDTVRLKVASLFKVSWWRGLGFGLIADFKTEPQGIEACVDDIDTRENPKGTWQWSVLHLASRRTAIGVHTWAQGYLTPTFNRVLQAYKEEGNAVAAFKKEKDKLMKFLTTAMDSSLRPPEYGVQ